MTGAPGPLFRAGVLAAYLADRRRRPTDAEQLRRWQRERLQRVLRRARHRYPHYRQLTSDDLAAFPILTKGDFLDHFADLNDRGLQLRRCLEVARAAEARRDFTAQLNGVSVGLSSGTSGRQGVFLTSAAERRRWAGTVLARALPEGLRAGARVALLLRAAGPLYESVGGGRVTFGYFDLARPLPRLLPPLVAFAPTVLVAPPRLLRALAEQRGSGQLPISPRRIFSVAEVLDPHDAAAITAGFGLRVDQIYQATEGFLGISCPRGSLHLNEDLVHVEREHLGAAVGGRQRFTPVITDLFRTTQAIIRMRLDDVLVTSGRSCDCGRPTLVIDAVEGRADDVLAFPTGTGGLRWFFADFARAAVLAAPGVRDFRLRQASPALVLLHVSPERAFPAAARALRDAVAAAGMRPPRVHPTEVEAEDPVVKLRRVRRDFPLPERPE